MMYSKGTKGRELRTIPKYKYTFNSKLYDLHMSTSLDQKIGATRMKNQNISTSILPQKIKSNASFSLEKLGNYSQIQPPRSVMSTSKKNAKGKELVKLPSIRKNLLNPQATSVKPVIQPETFYQGKVFRAFNIRENTYMMNLARQHFLQIIQAIKIGKNMKVSSPSKQIKLSKKNPKHKTIFLDLDQCLIHCDQAATNYTVKLNFPIQGGGTIPAGIRVRPYCQQFIKQLSSFAQIIIFTASANSYADVVLDYLDPHKKYFSHRLYRHHCTLEKGFYTKDLRIVNRRLEDIAIVDNSAFSFMNQPQFGIPILPFYHYAKDKELISLLDFLKRLVKEADMRKKIKQTFIWDKYLGTDQDPRKILIQNYGGTFGH